MEVTEVRVFPVEEERLKAYVAITFDNCFVVRDLKVINGNNGLFVAMPSKKRKDGTYRDTAHPLNNETRQMIESKVLEEYNKEIQKSKVLKSRFQMIMEKFNFELRALTFDVSFLIGVSSSGKTQVFGTWIRRFESSHPSQAINA